MCMISIPSTASTPHTTATAAVTLGILTDLFIVQSVCKVKSCVITFCVCVSVCVSFATFSHYYTDPDVSWGNGTGCPLVVHYWTDLLLVHGFRCCDSIAPNAKCQQVLVLTLCLVLIVVHYSEGLLF